MISKSEIINNETFEDRLKSEIPNIDIPIRRKEEKVVPVWGNEDDKNTTIDVYAVLDFVEFCYKNIQKAIKGNFHEYYKHYELSFEEGGKVQEEFRLEINIIFERNGIVFFLNEKGEVNRTIPKSMQSLIDDRPNTEDERLNELVNLAYDKFILPKYSDRVHALEKIWDAFERIKTYYSENKKTSIINWHTNAC